MASIAWYLKRLSVMRPAEIAHRVFEQFRLKQMHIVYRLKGGRGTGNTVQWDQCEFCTSADQQLPELPWEFGYDEGAVLRLMAGNVGALGYEWRWRERPGVWHEAPDTGEQWPQIYFGSIPYRTGNPYGDVRVAWEPSRFQHLIVLALLARHDANAERSRLAVKLIEDQFMSWLRDNPDMTGIHYISSMECALRMMAVCHAIDMVRDRLNLPETIWTGLVGMVYSHASLIEKRLSLHSSSGNHTIAECAGLVYAGTLFPEYKSAARWKSVGIRHLVREAERQILSDGGGIEQALCYQVFILDLLALVQELLSHDGVDVPPQITGAVTRGRIFINSMCQQAAEIPAIGDGDSGFALSPYLRLNWQNTLHSRVVTTFKESGYTIVRKNDAEQVKIIFDHGPLGMPPSYGHGHCDALSIMLNVNGKDLLIDPGTYTYTGDQDWRTYFRSSHAHNTVTVDGQDSAVQESAFQWSRPYKAVLHVAEQADDGTVRLLASHHGYRHLDVIHWRYFVLRSNGEVLIMDHLSGNGKHTLELNWHLEKLPVEDGGRYVLDEGVSLNVPGEQASLHYGECDPISGWKSPLYGIKEPSATLKVLYSGKLPYEFITTIEVNCSIDEVALVQEEKALARQWIK